MLRRSPLAHAKVPWRVLLVHPDRRSAESWAEALRDGGLTVRIANDPGAATEMARRFDPDVVLVDVGTPGFPGFAVARRLRTMLAGLDPSIIAFNSRNAAADRGAAQGAGCDMLLEAPLDVDALLHTLKEQGGSPGPQVVRQGP